MPTVVAKSREVETVPRSNRNRVATTRFDERTPAARHRFRALFTSDLHLGTPGCQAGSLLAFLRRTESDYLYLVGDIVDGWQLKRRWYWHQSHNDVVQKLLRKARKGTKVVYVPGNHDEAARHFVGVAFGDIAIVDEAVHVTADGRRLLVTHGDLFDGVIQYAKWLALLGDALYTLTLKLNQHVNAVRARLGLRYWSLSQFMKLKVKNAVSYITAFEAAVAHEAKRRDFDGRRLRPHPQGRDPRDRRRPLLQRRRLGREPHGARRNLRRGADDPACAGNSYRAGVAGRTCGRRRPQTRARWRMIVASTVAPMRIQIITDAWSPQVNGVVVTLINTIAELRRLGHSVALVTPNGFHTIPTPSYPEIPLALFPGREVARRIDAFEPQAVHIATEGPLGLAARRHCLRIGQPFSTAYHTQFPEYVHARCRLPVFVSYMWLRRFHAPSTAVMCGTPAIIDRLAARGFDNLVLWSRGVDTKLFAPAEREPRERERPIFMYAGRVAVEKNIAAFCELDLPGTKWIVGDGPARAQLQADYPRVRFLGMQHGKALAACYQQADVFVFPSRTDTFGLVLIEAMACGTPVAAYPVTGPLDVVTDRAAGMLSDDLRHAALAALACDRDAVRRFGQRFSWEAATRQFVQHLERRAPGAAADAVLDVD